MAQSLKWASALAMAASLALWSSPLAATNTPDVATTGSLIGPRAAPAGPAGRTTTIRSAIGPDLCVSLDLPGLWKVERPEPHRINAIDADKGTLIEILAYTERDFAPGPGTLIQRAAANLQQEYERLLGKPVQATTLEPVPGHAAMRWTATWIDGNFAQDDRALSLEEFILEPVPDRIVELKVSQAGDRGDVTRPALETLTVQSTEACPL
jgi:hypothetical protein